MATYSLAKLSGSTDGKGIKVTGTTSGTDVTIHTADADSGDIDFVSLYAYNSDSSDRTLTIAWGAETSPDNLIVFTVPATTMAFLIDRLPIMNSLVIGAWASSANVVMVYGHVQNVDN